MKYLLDEKNVLNLKAFDEFTSELCYPASHHAFPRTNTTHLQPRHVRLRKNAADIEKGYSEGWPHSEG